VREEGPVVGIHAVLGALASSRRTLDRVLVDRSRGGPRIRQVLEAARRAGVPVALVDRERLDRMAAGLRHQGVAGLPASAAYVPVESLVAACEPAGRLVILDGVEDPRNVGAVVRTAAGAGVRGVVIPEHRSAGLTPAALRASAGALSAVGVARCRNAADLANDLKEKGFWVAGLDPAGETPWDRAPYPARMALVVGGEAAGLRQRLRAACDALVAIPLAAGVESLNLSVAAAIVLYEAVRRDRSGGGGGSG
jgi:23S rRNA (guanosine2251-2'-O)-methyltransferase